MGRLELDFLRTRPPLPATAWLLLAAGIVLAALAGQRYLEVSDGLARERAVAARLAPASRPAAPRPAPDDGLARLAWGELFARLEATRPADIALLALDADGRKGGLKLTAEARSAAAMIDYLEALRRQGGFSAVTLVSHGLAASEAGVESVRFVASLGWGP